MHGDQHAENQNGSDDIHEITPYRTRFWSTRGRARRVGPPRGSPPASALDLHHRSRSAASTSAGMSLKPISRPAGTAPTASSFAPLRTAQAVPPVRGALHARAQAAGRRRRPARRRSAAPQESRSSGSVRVLRPVRIGHGVAGWGCCMSGVPSCASIAPSRYSTSEWTMLWRWMTASTCSQRQPVEPHGLDDLKALVHQRRGVDGDLRAHRPVGVTQRVRRASSARKLLAGLTDRTARPSRSGSGA